MLFRPARGCYSLTSMNLRERKVEDVVLPGHIRDYEQLVGFIWDEIVHLRVTLLILRRVGEFPFDALHLADPMDGWFFAVVKTNFFDALVQGIDRLWRDEKMSFTIGSLREVVLGMIKEDVQGFVQEAWEREQASAQIDHIAERIMRIRHQYASHRSPKSIENLRKAKIGVRLDELETVVDAMERLFHTLTFGTEHLMLPPAYSERVSRPGGHTTDVDHLLDAYGSYSPLVDLPETNPYLWPMMRNRISPETMKLINRYRVKRGLSEIE
jgi:hypothetical protein